jgi:aryl-alcohol dehydrogenase-like predicted oxidoreductase
MSLVDSALLSDLALGCAKFGSINGISQTEALKLMRLAYNRGIRTFDTATSYGQGDSERILGIFARQYPDIYVMTKVGKVVPFKARLIQPVKALVRAVSKRSSHTSSAIQRDRGDRLRTDFNLGYLRAQFQASRHRLGMERVAVVLLHSPPANVIACGDAMAFLESERDAGTIGAIGVSVDDSAAAEAALVDPRVSVIQLPLAETDTWAIELLPRLKAAGKAVVVREIFRDARLSVQDGRSEQILRVFRRVSACDGVDTTLLGTTKLQHLNELLDLRAAIKVAS